jgi:iron uptake system component EfeO
MGGRLAGGRMSTRRRLEVFFGVLALIVVCGIVAQLTARSASSGSSNTASAAGTAVGIRADIGACGIGWKDPQPGTETFAVTNTSTEGMEVYLESAKTRAVYLDIEGIGAGATASGSATLGDGTYRFVCLPSDADPTVGARVTVTGKYSGGAETPGITPVTNNELIPAAKAYTSWVAGRLPVLQTQVGLLVSAVDAGDIPQAEQAWLAAHETYETLGAAYDAFGDYDTKINASPVNGQSALTDPSLTGFHKIEALLWSGASAQSTAPYASGLADDVAGLRTWFAGQEITPLDMGVRAHEILENALQFELTGADDAGSGTTLATVDANITGTDEALAPLHGILVSRDPELAQTQAWLNRTQELIESYRNAQGVWEPLTDLTTTQREQIDADVDQTLELLSRVAAICDPRRSA